MNIEPDKTGMTETERFFEVLRGSLAEQTLVRVVLGKYRGQEPELKRISIRPIELKGRQTLSFVYRYRTRDITTNHPVEEGLEVIRGLLGRDFKSAHLFSLAGDVQLVFGKKGRGILSRGKPTSETTGISPAHAAMIS